MAPRAVEVSGRPAVSSSIREAEPVAVSSTTARSAADTFRWWARRRSTFAALKSPDVARRSATKAGSSWSRSPASRMTRNATCSSSSRTWRV